MKKKRIWEALLVASSLLPCLCLIGLVSALPGHAEARKERSWLFCNSLEVPLVDDELGDLDQLEGKLLQFKANFTSLAVSNNHRLALEKAEEILERIRVLRTETPQPERDVYETELTELRSDVQLIPRIGKAAFEESSPWLIGLVSFAWTSWFLPGFLLVWAVIIAPVVFLLMKNLDGPISDDTDHSSRTGGVSRGYRHQAGVGFYPYVCGSYGPYGPGSPLRHPIYPPYGCSRYTGNDGYSSRGSV